MTNHSSASRGKKMKGKNLKGKSGKSGKIKISSARQAALKALKLVFSGQSLSAVQPQTIDVLEDKRDRGLANEIVNGVLRWRWQLEFFTAQLLSKKLKAKDQDVQLILLMALYELTECRTPDYAVINESVELVRKSGKQWAGSLVNAILRRYTREKEELAEVLKVDAARFSHPEWMLEKFKKDWPEQWQQLIESNNQRPAFWLRVNKRQNDVLQYKQLLDENDIESEITELSDQALKLAQGLDVRLLPGFSDGAVSVQDAGAQLSANLLNVLDGQRVLDLCAAPGGKTTHILERHSTIKKLVAVEVDEKRMQRVQENLQRLKLNEVDNHQTITELVVADARDYKQWWDGEYFDRILIDAPCSASGVIRRHPDIKSLRRESDIQTLVDLQSEILAVAWQMLAVGGELLYITCSVFKDENQKQIKRFIAAMKASAQEIIIDAEWGVACEYGRQLFPGEKEADGFYFCRLKKVDSLI